jgi:hypothetical protein
MKKPTGTLRQKNSAPPFSSNPEEAKRLRQEALESAFMRIPRIKIETARDLLDLGFTQPYQIAGRAPETLFADLLKRKPGLPADRLAGLRLAVQSAESA